MSAGKGDTPRQLSVSRSRYAENWERVFADDHPQCGKDFCEECGDCLDCHGGEGGPCVHSASGHVWVRREGSHS